MRSISICRTFCIGVLAVSCLIALVALTSRSTRCRQRWRWRRKVNLKEAGDLYRSAGEEFRTAFDKHNLAAALSGGGYVSVSLGDYTGAVKAAEEAVKLRRALHENGKIGTDLNTIGLAYQYQGNYATALEHYQER